MLLPTDMSNSCFLLGNHVYLYIPNRGSISKLNKPCPHSSSEIENVHNYSSHLDPESETVGDGQ